MPSASRFAALVTVLSFVAPFACAQSLLRVGPGQPFADIQSAAGIARAGDVVEVLAGSYAPFSLTSGATLRAAPGAVVLVQATAGTATTRFAIPVGQHARVCGITFANPPSGSAQPTQFVLVDAGTGVISFENCDFAGSVSPALTVFRGNVTLRACTLAHGTSALSARFARIAAVQCTFTGDDSVQLNTVANAAVAVTDSDLQLTGCTLTGGDGIALFPYTAIGSGLSLAGNANAWLEGCTITGGNAYAGAPAPGAIGLRNEGTGIVKHQRCSVQGGNGGGVFGQAAPMTTAQGSIVATPVTGVSASLGGLRLGYTFAANVAGEPLQPVYVLATFGLTPPPADPNLDGIQWGLIPPTGVFAGFALADLNGRATFGWYVPQQPALRDLGLWFTAISGATLPLHVTPPFGGVVR